MEIIHRRITEQSHFLTIAVVATGVITTASLSLRHQIKSRFKRYRQESMLDERVGTSNLMEPIIVYAPGTNELTPSYAQEFTTIRIPMTPNHYGCSRQQMCKSSSKLNHTPQLILPIGQQLISRIGSSHHHATNHQRPPPTPVPRTHSV